MKFYNRELELAELKRIQLLGSVYSLMHKIFQEEKEPLFGRADNIIAT